MSRRVAMEKRDDVPWIDLTVIVLPDEKKKVPPPTGRGGDPTGKSHTVQDMKTPLTTALAHHDKP